MNPPSLIFDYAVASEDDVVGAPRILQVRGNLLAGADGYPYFRDEQDPVLVPPGERSYTYWVSFPFFLPGAEETGGFGEGVAVPENRFVRAGTSEAELRVDDLPYNAWRDVTLLAMSTFGDIKAGIRGERGGIPGAVRCHGGAVDGDLLVGSDPGGFRDNWWWGVD